MLDNSKLTNPAKKFIRFKGGRFTYWDKTASIEVELDHKKMRFIPITALSTISGFDQKNGCGIYSNEVKSLKSPLTVKSFKGGEIASGLYHDIKDKVRSCGGKYTLSVYALMDGELVNFQLAGAGRGNWFDDDMYSASAIEIAELVDDKMGATKFKKPVFKKAEASEAELKDAYDLRDRHLNPYLDQYLKKDAEEEKATAEDFEFDKDDDLPF